jgi:hypothetical protein
LERFGGPHPERIGAEMHMAIGGAGARASTNGWWINFDGLTDAN